MESRQFSRTTDTEELRKMCDDEDDVTQKRQVVHTRKNVSLFKNRKEIHKLLKSSRCIEVLMVFCFFFFFVLLLVETLE